MPDVSVLEVLLYDEPIGTLTHLQGDRTLFAFNQAYVDNPDRPTLSLSFKDSLGDLITDIRPTQTRVPPFFANLLPEGAMRDYLAEKAGVNPKREFFLLWVLGRDLPGALTIRPADGEAWPPGEDRQDREEQEKTRRNALRFSLAGVQLKFSAVKEATGGLTIPAEGVGGSWIVKLPSTRFEGVPENEFSMMNLALRIGIDVPDVQLVDIDSIAGLPDGMGDLGRQALAVRRFDRTAEGPVHIEDFAQVFGVFPDDKYRKASYRNIAEVLGIEAGDDAAAEFIRRLVFSALIGNADMHLKNWSLIYPDRRHARLSPAYDFVSTIPYLPDDKAALTYARTKRMDGLTLDEIAYLATKAGLPQKPMIDTAKETVTRFHDVWTAERGNLPISQKLAQAIDEHVAKLPIAREG
jgi:serine/threonine-protein kinase HipA